MKFIDSAKIAIRSGKGGAGCSSMRREKYIEFGGPDGGNGGKGGDVYFKGDTRLVTLQDFRINPHLSAQNGMPGMGSQKSGKSGEDLVIRVPLGTMVIDEATKETCFEVLNEQEYLLLKGGRGGLGNVNFKSSTNRAPTYSQPGEPGQEMTVLLELKIMADIGLVGFPNAGKSTLIASISNAHPKIADYPFTTLIPNLGVVRVSDEKSFVVADIPGIIEGAHQGLGLGDRFLRHIQRTCALAFLIDSSEFTQSSPWEVFQVLKNELQAFSPDLIDKKRIILLSKIDAIRSDLDIKSTIQEFKAKGEELYAISSVARKGLDRVIYRMMTLVEERRSGTLEGNQQQSDTEE